MAKVLEKIKQSAEKKCRRSVTKCVITVPAYYNDLQKSQTLNAAKIAGLDCKRLICEPTAAAIAYAHDQALFIGN